MRRSSPEVNAGSMADIAFLLLIFFLVTTTIVTDHGISRKLPQVVDTPTIDPPKIRERNLFRVELNGLNELLVEKAPMQLSELREAAITFLDNGSGADNKTCAYCKGEKKTTSSDHPEQAIIALRNSRETNYATYVAVQNELIAAYTTLRDRESKRLYGISFQEMKRQYKDGSYSGDHTKLKAKILNVQSMYPEKLTEAVTQ